MNDLNKSLSELDALIAKHEEVQNQIFCNYVEIVNAFLKNEITSEQVTKKIMDGLANFEDEGFFSGVSEAMFPCLSLLPTIGKQYGFFHACGNSESRFIRQSRQL